MLQPSLNKDIFPDDNTDLCLVEETFPSPSIQLSTPLFAIPQPQPPQQSLIDLLEKTIREDGLVGVTAPEFTILAVRKLLDKLLTMDLTNINLGQSTEPGELHAKILYSYHQSFLLCKDYSLWNLSLNTFKPTSK